MSMIKQTKMLRGLTTSKERQELRAIEDTRELKRYAMSLLAMKSGEIATLPKGTTIRRSFDQSDFNGGMIAYFRVIAPVTHRNYESDLSLEGLKDWGII